MRPFRTWPVNGGEFEREVETIGQPPMSRKLERPGARWKGKAVGCGGRGIDVGGRIALAGSELVITYERRKKANEALTWRNREGIYSIAKKELPQRIVRESRK